MSYGLGKEGEGRACSYLRRRGYRILERNFCSPYGELDIIASGGGFLVFCEVKTRSNGGITEALEAVDKKKQGRIIKIASHYLASRDCSENRCRFDVIALLRNGGKWKIEHVKDAFEVGEL